MVANLLTDGPYKTYRTRSLRQRVVARPFDMETKQLHPTAVERRSLHTEEGTMDLNRFACPVILNLQMPIQWNGVKQLSVDIHRIISLSGNRNRALLPTKRPAVHLFGRKHAYPCTDTDSHQHHTQHRQYGKQPLLLYVLKLVIPLRNPCFHHDHIINPSAMICSFFFVFIPFVCTKIGSSRLNKKEDLQSVEVGL